MAMLSVLRFSALIRPQGVSHCQLAIPSRVPLNNHTLFSFLKPAVYPLFSLLSAEDPNMGNKDFPGITGAVRGKSHVLPPTHLSRGQCLGPCSLSSLYLLWIELSTLHLKLNPSPEHHPSPLLQWPLSFLSHQDPPLHWTILISIQT